MHEIIIQPMQESHLPQVLKIEQECFGVDAWTTGMLQGFIKDPDSYCIICLLGNEIIGFAMMWILEKVQEAEIGNIAVKPVCRGFGAGDAMVTAILEASREKGIIDIFLEVRKNNMPAQKLYKKHGFIAVGIRKDYYQNPIEDAVLMTKVLEVNREKA